MRWTCSDNMAFALADAAFALAVASWAICSTLWRVRERTDSLELLLLVNEPCWEDWLECWEGGGDSEP